MNKIILLIALFTCSFAQADDIRKWKKEHCFLCQVDAQGHLLIPMYKGPQAYYRMQVIRADKSHISLKMVGLTNTHGVQTQSDMNLGTEFERNSFIGALKGICTAYFTPKFEYYSSGFSYTQGRNNMQFGATSRGRIELGCVVINPRDEMGWGDWVMSYLPGKKVNQDERGSEKILVLPVAPRENSRKASRQ